MQNISWKLAKEQFILNFLFPEHSMFFLRDLSLTFIRGKTFIIYSWFSISVRLHTLDTYFNIYFSVITHALFTAWNLLKFYNILHCFYGEKPQVTSRGITSENTRYFFVYSWLLLWNFLWKVKLGTFYLLQTVFS